MKTENNNSGFTLLEVIISIFILSIGIAGSVSLIASTTQLIGESKNRVIAANLAQEGVEITRVIRDTNWLANPALPFDDGFEDNQGDNCLDYQDTTFAIFPCASPDSKLYWNAVRYTHDQAGLETLFERVIRIELIPNPEKPAEDIIRVQSIVTWGNNTIIAEEHLYDWK